MKNRTSNFTTIGGLLFLAVLVVYTNARGYRHAAGFLIFFLILFLASWLWGQNALKKISMTLQQEDLCAFPGETIPIRLHFHNQKLLPIVWMDVLFPLPPGKYIWALQEEEIILHEDPDLPKLIPVLPCRLTWLLPGQTVEWSLQLDAKSRGVLRLSHIYLESGDGFGLSVVSRKIPLNCPRQLTVYPERIPADVSPLIQQNHAEAPGIRGYQEDLSLLKHSRLYQINDSFRRINWRLMARQQQLMVNEYETVSPQCMGFYVDLESFVTYQTEKLSSGSTLSIPTLHRVELEKMLSLTGSCICELTERHISCALLIPAYADRETVFCAGQDMEYQIPLLLGELARISYDEDHPETHVDIAELRRARSCVGSLFLTGMHLSRMKPGPFEEMCGSHMLSFIVLEKRPEEMLPDRPVLTFSDLSRVSEDQKL